MTGRWLIALLGLTIAVATGSAAEADALSYKVIAFYYPWYGAPAKGTRRGWYGWGDARHAPPADIYSRFYPVLGPYDSQKDDVIAAHVAMLKHARIGVICVEWWGRGHRLETRTYMKLFSECRRAKIKICFHIGPYGTEDQPRSVDSVQADIQHILDTYGVEKAMFRNRGKPLFFLWDVHGDGATMEQWAIALLKLRNRGYRFDVLAQTLDYRALEYFDGYYNYDLVGYQDNFAEVYANMAAHARKQGKIFAPSVGPGYDDRRAGRDRVIPRADGAFYDKAWQAAMAADPTFVAITSFNEWGESTQIEAADSSPPDGHGYETYEGAFGCQGEDAPYAYLDRTAHWIGQWERAAKP